MTRSLVQLKSLKCRERFLRNVDFLNLLSLITFSISNVGKLNSQPALLSVEQQQNEGSGHFWLRCTILKSVNLFVVGL